MSQLSESTRFVTRFSFPYKDYSRVNNGLLLKSIVERDDVRAVVAFVVDEVEKRAFLIPLLILIA